MENEPVVIVLLPAGRGGAPGNSAPQSQNKPKYRTAMGKVLYNLQKTTPEYDIFPK